MRIRTAILLVLSLPFLGFFAIGITDFGQKLLRGDIPVGTDHWKADDIAMGAGLAPMAYGLIPFVLLGGSGLISLVFDWHVRRVLSKLKQNER